MTKEYQQLQKKQPEQFYQEQSQSQQHVYMLNNNQSHTENKQTLINNNFYDERSLKYIRYSNGLDNNNC